MNVEALERQNAQLNEQVKLLVRTEKRLYATQRQVENQLHRIHALNTFALTAPQSYSEVEILNQTIELLWSLFPIHVAAGALWGGTEEDAPLVLARMGDDVPAPVAMPPEISALLKSEPFNGALILRQEDAAGRLAPLFRWLDELVPAPLWEDTRSEETVMGAQHRDLPSQTDVVLPIATAERNRSPKAILIVRSAAMSFTDVVPEEADRSFLDLVCRHVSNAMEIAALHADLEKRVDARTRELATANEQLEGSLQTLRATQTQLLQASKMAAVGQLAAGVSHEINNPLAIILGFAQGIERRLSPAEEGLRVPVTSIVREALRCKNLVQELLTFSRTGKNVMEAVDLARTLESAGRLLESRARLQDTQIVMELARDVPPIQANEIQLQQVVINLGNNGLDALVKGGRLILRLLPPKKGQVILEVEDTGPGIPDEIRPRIFEPFFTTKEVGKGTGLGLSLVYEIVQQHSGAIEVRSELGQGTRMSVRLPVVPIRPPATETEPSQGGPP